MPVACWPASLDPASNHRQMEPEEHSGLTSGLRMHASVHALRQYTHTAKVNVVGFLIAPFLSFSFSAHYTFLGSLFAKGYQVSLCSPGWLAVIMKSRLTSHLQSTYLSFLSREFGIMPYLVLLGNLCKSVTGWPVVQWGSL